MFATSLRAPSPAAATLMVSLSTLGFGLVPWFAKELLAAGIAVVAVAFFRFFLSGLVLLPFVARAPEKRGESLWALATGVVVALGWLGYAKALESEPVATLGVIYMTYPLFTLLIAWIWQGLRPSPRALGGGLLVLLAALLALAPAALLPGSLGTLLLAFTAPASFGFGITVLTLKLHRLTAVERSAGFFLGAVLGLLPLIVSLPVSRILPSGPEAWLLILGISLVTALIPNLLYALAAPFIGPGRTAMAGSVELPTMFLVAWLAFGEAIGALQALAGALVILAILVTPTTSRLNAA